MIRHQRRRASHPFGIRCRAVLVLLLALATGVPLTAAQKIEPITVDGNEIILRVDRFCFTRADIDATAQTHMYADWAQVMQAREARAEHPDQVSEAEMRVLEGNLERRAIRLLISNTMAIQEIDPDRFRDQYNAIGQGYDRYIQQSFGSIEQYMALRRWTREEVETERRGEIARQVRQWVIGNLVQNATKVTSQDMRTYYEKNKNLFTREKGYKIRVLVLDPKKHAPDVNLYALAEGYRREYLEQKDSFENLVRKHSDNEPTKKDDGLWRNYQTLGEALAHLEAEPDQDQWMTSIKGSQLNAEWMAMAHTLDPSQREKSISRVLTGNQVYSLVYLEAVRPARLLEYRQVPTDVLRDLTQKRKGELAINRWTDKKLADARIVYRGEVVPYSKFWDEALDE